MTLYPDGIDSTLQLPTIAGADGYIIAINALRDAVIAIETELGITPHGAYSDAVTRLAILESRVGPGATITGGSIDINDANLAGVLTVAKGGTGLPSVGAVHTVVTSTATANLYKLLGDDNIDSAADIAVSKLAPSSTDGYFLTTTTGVAIWEPLSISDIASGILAVANGGTGLSSLGTGITTFLGTPSSANLATAVTGETGSGALVFGTSPTIATPTISSPTITGNIIFQGTRLRILSVPGEVQTTDATVTTVASFTMLDETLCAFDVIVTAALQTNVTDGGRWKRSVVYRRTAAGIPIIVGTLETGTDQEVTAGLDVTIDSDGVDTIRVRVTGIAATNFNWTCELRVQETVATV
jgi:hypothetical protein